MEPSVYEVESRVEANHWWFAGRRRLLARVIAGLDLAKDTRVLDVGSGTGTNLRLLAELGFIDVTGVDRSESAIRFCAEKGLGAVEMGDVRALPCEDRSVDLVIATDIIEHVADDAAALREIRRVLKPGGRAILTVPAFESLWGLQDEVSHHERRYRQRDFESRIEAAGLALREGFHFNYLLFVPIWIARQLIRIFRIRLESENQLNTSMLNDVLTRLFAFDVWSAPRLRPPFGVSLFALTERTDAGSDPAASAPTVDTSRRFGFQWDLHREFHPQYREQFLQWIAPLDERAFEGVDVLDAGCGMGRNAHWALEFGAKTVAGVDYSELAVASARKVLSGRSNASVRRVSLYDLEDIESYDLCFSVGVIHHLEFPRRAVERLIQTLRPGGRLVVWLYGFEGNELWARTFGLIHPILRRLSPRALHALAHLFSVPLYLLLKLPWKKSPYLEAVARYPYGHTHLIVHDQLVPEIARYYTRAEVEALFAGLPVSQCEIHHNREYSWTVICRK